MAARPQQDEEREALVAQTFVQLTDNLVDSFDLIELLTVLATRSVEILDAAAVGILLADSSGRLRVMAASDDRTETLELFQLQNDEGPCLDCYATGTRIESDLLVDGPWPTFAAECLRVGFRAVTALPLRLRGDILGAMNLFMVNTGGMSRADLELAQALADVASITIIQDQAARLSALRQQQLQHALNSRTLIEQAKGMIAEHDGVDMDGAFARLRNHARRHRLLLTDVARDLVVGQIRGDDLDQRAH